MQNQINSIAGSIGEALFRSKAISSLAQSVVNQKEQIQQMEALRSEQHTANKLAWKNTASTLELDDDEIDPIVNEQFTAEDVKNNPQGIVDYANAHPYDDKALEDERKLGNFMGKQEYSKKLQEFTTRNRAKGVMLKEKLKGSVLNPYGGEEE